MFLSLSFQAIEDKEGEEEEGGEEEEKQDKESSGNEEGEENCYDIQAIFDIKRSGNATKYHVKWLDYDIR